MLLVFVDYHMAALVTLVSVLQIAIVGELASAIHLAHETALANSGTLAALAFKVVHHTLVAVWVAHFNPAACSQCRQGDQHNRNNGQNKFLFHNKISSINANDWFCL